MPQLKKYYYDKFGRLQKGPNKRVVRVVEMYHGRSDESESSDSDCDGAKGSPMVKHADDGNQSRERSPQRPSHQHTATTMDESNSRSRLGQLTDIRADESPPGERQLPRDHVPHGNNEEEKVGGLVVPRFSAEGDSDVVEPWRQYADRIIDEVVLEIRVEGDISHSKQCFENHGGYCHDPIKLGVAEHAVLDRRQDRGRKVREKKTLKYKQTNVSDRYVFACCKAVRRYLDRFHELYALKENVTRDKITIAAPGVDQIDDEVRQRQILDGPRVSTESMREAYETALRCAAKRSLTSNRKQYQWVVPPTDITGGGNDRTLSDEWKTELEGCINIYERFCPVVGEDMRPQGIMIPIHVVKGKWACVDVEMRNNGKATIFTPGWDPTESRERIKAAALTVIDQIRGTKWAPIAQDAGNPTMTWGEKGNRQITLRENGAATALMMWKRLVHCAPGYTIITEPDYFRLQRDELYTNIQLRSEVIPVMALEEQGREGIDLNQPKEYVGAGTYFSNSNKSALPRQPADPRDQDQRRRRDAKGKEKHKTLKRK